MFVQTSQAITNRTDVWLCIARRNSNPRQIRIAPVIVRATGVKYPKHLPLLYEQEMHRRIGNHDECSGDDRQSDDIRPERQGIKPKGA